MFNNQFILSKIIFLIFFLQKNYFSNLNRVRNMDGIPDTQRVYRYDNKF